MAEVSIHRRKCEELDRDGGTTPGGEAFPASRRSWGRTAGRRCVTLRGGSRCCCLGRESAVPFSMPRRAAGKIAAGDGAGGSSAATFFFFDSRYEQRTWRAMSAGPSTVVAAQKRAAHPGISSSRCLLLDVRWTISACRRCWKDIVFHLQDFSVQEISRCAAISR